MRFFFCLLLTAALSFAACLFLPWWVIAIAGFAVSAAIPQRSFRSFLSGFLGVFLLWFALCFWISSANNDLFAHKISMLVIKADNPLLLMAITALIGGLVAGMGALTGSFLRKRDKMTDVRH